MIVHDFTILEKMALSPGVLAEAVVFACVYPIPFVIISMLTIDPFETFAFALHPTPSPTIIISGVLKKLSPPCFIII